MQVLLDERLGCHSKFVALSAHLVYDLCRQPVHSCIPFLVSGLLTNDVACHLRYIYTSSRPALSIAAAHAHHEQLSKSPCLSAISISKLRSNIFTMSTPLNK